MVVAQQTDEVSETTPQTGAETRTDKATTVSRKLKKPRVKQ